MPLDLSSSNWKIDRAVELLQGLDTEVLAWINTKPYSCFTYVNPEKTRATVNVREHHAPPIVRWSLAVADIIHNLRCALDHAFWAALQSEFPAGIPKSAERLSFPIWDSAPNNDLRRNFQPIGAKLFAAVESVQPYNHPQSIYPVHPLTIIRDIDNGNKHKVLFTLMPSVAMLNIRVEGMRDNDPQGHIETLYRGELKDGVEAVVTTFSRPQPYVKYECVSFSCIIAIKHPVSGRLGQDRDDYAALIDAMILQIRTTIANFAAAVT